MDAFVDANCKSSDGAKMTNYPSDLSAASFNRAHDQLDAERTVYPVKRGGEGALVVLKASVEEAMKLKRIDTRVKVPVRP